MAEGHSMLWLRTQERRGRRVSCAELMERPATLCSVCWPSGGDDDRRHRNWLARRAGSPTDASIRDLPVYYMRGCRAGRAAGDVNRPTLDAQQLNNGAAQLVVQFIMYGRVRSNGCELQRDIRYDTAPPPPPPLPATPLR